MLAPPPWTVLARMTSLLVIISLTLIVLGELLITGKGHMHEPLL